MNPITQFKFNKPKKIHYSNFSVVSEFEFFCTHGCEKTHPAGQQKLNLECIEYFLKEYHWNKKQKISSSSSLASLSSDEENDFRPIDPSNNHGGLLIYYMGCLEQLIEYMIYSGVASDNINFRKGATINLSSSLLFMSSSSVSGSSLSSGVSSSTSSLNSNDSREYLIPRAFEKSLWHLPPILTDQTDRVRKRILRKLLNEKIIYANHDQKHILNDENYFYNMTSIALLVIKSLLLDELELKNKIKSLNRIH